MLVVFACEGLGEAKGGEEVVWGRGATLWGGRVFVAHWIDEVEDWGSDKG